MDVESQILSWFHHFHENPEISWKEYETTNKLAEIHLVIATRENPRLPLGRLRAQGHLTELDVKNSLVG